MEAGDCASVRFLSGARLYLCARCRPGQYCGGTPGLLAEPINRQERTREISRAVADRVAPAASRIPDLARAAVRAHHGGLGVPVERLGQAPRPAADHRELRQLGVPFPHLLTPFVSGVEFFGGLFLLIGLLTRISAGALGITMIVAIRAAKWADVDSLETLLGFDEFEYLALFLWLAIAGAGALSVDHWLERRFSFPRGGNGADVTPNASPGKLRA